MAGTGKKREAYNLVNEIREAIRDSGQSLYQISHSSGVTASQLSRFMRGERTLTLPAAAKIVRRFACVLWAIPPPMSRKAPRPRSGRRGRRSRVERARPTNQRKGLFYAAESTPSAAPPRASMRPSCCRTPSTRCRRRWSCSDSTWPGVQWCAGPGRDGRGASGAFGENRCNRSCG